MTHIYPTPEEVWRDFTSEESPRDFVVRLSGDTVEACVEAHLDTLPSVFGIMRNASWNSTFRQPWQLRRDEVRHGLLAYLEAHRDIWGVSETDAPYQPEVSDAAAVSSESDAYEVQVEAGMSDERGEAVEVTGQAPFEGVASEGASSDEPPAGNEERPQPGE